MIYFLVFCISCIFIVLGLIKPSLALFWLKSISKNSRIISFFFYFGLAFFSIVLGVYTDTKAEDKNFTLVFGCICTSLVWLIAYMVHIKITQKNKLVAQDIKTQTTPNNTQNVKIHTEITNHTKEDKAQVENQNSTQDVEIHAETINHTENDTQKIKPSEAKHKKPRFMPTFIYNAKLEKEAITSLLQNGPEATFKSLAELEHINFDYTKIAAAVKKNIQAVLDIALADSYLSEKEEADIKQFLALAAYNLQADSILNRKLSQAIIIRNLLQKNVTPMFTTSPVLTSKNEVIIWYDEEEIKTTKMVRQYHAGSRGVSVKVAKGVYVRLGASKGHSESKEVLTSLGLGHVVITTKNVYIGAKLNKKIPLSKILSLEPYKNYLIIWAENNRGKPIYIMTKDAQFYANAITNAENWA